MMFFFNISVTKYLVKRQQMYGIRAIGLSTETQQFSYWAITALMSTIYNIYLACNKGNNQLNMQNIEEYRHLISASVGSGRLKR